tara:strand:- start:251 stop:427 length:177 start_codon:yes stop_codon:yes gene_type:complete
MFKIKKSIMKKLFKVVCKGVLFGTYNTIEKARQLRGILKRRGKSDIVIKVSQEDIDTK